MLGAKPPSSPTLQASSPYLACRIVRQNMAFGKREEKSTKADDIYSKIHTFHDVE
jgi:hypothetical protein